MVRPRDSNPRPPAPKADALPTGLSRHQAKLNPIKSEMCDKCKVTESVEHYLFDCDKYEEETKFKKSGDQDTKTKFQTLRQQIKKKSKDSYQGYLENLLGLNDSDNNCDSKKLFSFLKNSRRDQQGTPPLKHNNILHSDTKTKANIIFNQQFNSVFTSKEPLSLSRLAKMWVQDLRNAGGLPSDTIPDRQQDSNINMPEIDISLNGLLKLLHNLKPGKAARPDKLKPLLLRELRDEVDPIIKVIFDRSLQTGKLPTDWTKANVMPVFKKGDKSLAANNRPISLTCILCKVLERILASNIVKHLDGQGILYDLQHGFREKRSCETQLIMLIEDLARGASVGKQTDIILLDFSKAFDKVNHSKLLWKLHQ